MIKIAVCQIKTTTDWEETMSRAETMVRDAAANGADFAVFPEMFNCPYDTKMFPEYAEEEGDTCWKICSELARKHHVYLAAGSMPEKDKEGKIYNTSYVFDRSGSQIAKYRKMRHTVSITRRCCAESRCGKGESLVGRS